MAKTFADVTRELADRATERSRERWWVSLDEPTTTLFATTEDKAHVNLMATLYSDGIAAHVARTDRPDVACIRTESPICVLAVAEELMPALVGTLRRNRLSGTYRKAGTRDEYRF